MGVNYVYVVGTGIGGGEGWVEGQDGLLRDGKVEIGDAVVEFEELIEGGTEGSRNGSGGRNVLVFTCCGGWSGLRLGSLAGYSSPCGPLSV